MKQIILCIALLYSIATYSQTKQVEFPGGMPKFYEYVNKNMLYPKDAKGKKISGRVFIEFIIKADGYIDKENIKIIKGIYESCDKEAIRLIKESPRWKPALEVGKPVSQKFVMAIIFSL